MHGAATQSLRTRRVRRAIAGAAAAAGLAGCGSSSSTTPAGSAAVPTLTSAATPAATPAGASSASSTAASPSATAAGGGPPGVVLLHSVTSNAGVDLRINAAGSWRSVRVLPPGSFVWDAASGEVLAFEAGSGNSVVVVDLATGAVHQVASGATGNGGALSPDGTKVAYVSSESGGGFALRVATIATGSSQVLATYATGPVPAPLKWGADGILADLFVPNSGAPSQGVVRIDPSNGHELARSTGAGQHGMIACEDGDHVLTADHSSGLGDDGDAPPGPGPQGNPNTLRLVTVGGSATILRKAAHHQVEPLACVPDGSIAVYMDGSSAGGFAGISQSSEFGLFRVNGGARTQLDHYGATYDSATFLQDGSVVADKTDTSGSTVVSFAPNGLFGGDAVPGATGGRVDLVVLGG